VVLTFPVAQPAGERPACTVAIEIVVEPAETTRVWGHEAVELDESATTGRFASNRPRWDRQELEWFEAGERLHEQPVEDQTDARDPRGLAAPARRRLLLVLCASAVAAFVLALACIDLVARCN
jgi:hypothetical protein